MNIQLPNDLEKAVQAIAFSRGYETVSAYLIDVLQRDIESFEAEQKVAHYQNTPEWRTELREWAANHPATDHVIDTDRDSIYGLRGL